MRSSCAAAAAWASGLATRRRAAKWPSCSPYHPCSRWRSDDRLGSYAGACGSVVATAAGTGHSYALRASLVARVDVAWLSAHRHTSFCAASSAWPKRGDWRLLSAFKDSNECKEQQHCAASNFLAPLRRCQDCLCRLHYSGALQPTPCGARDGSAATWELQQSI